MSTPTDAQIKQVQTNLTNMQALNDYVYNQGQSKILNAFLLLTEPDSEDPGLEIGLNILEGAFWGIGGELGPIGSFAASFLSGMVNWWADSSNTPPSLNETFASLLTRVQETSLQVDTQLADYYQDVPGNWDTSFTYNGQTTTLEDLSTIQFPAETDPEFEQLAAAALFAFDQTVWSTVLKANMVVTLWETSQPLIISGGESDPPTSWDEGFIKQNPAYYNTWSYTSGTKCVQPAGWMINEYHLGTGAGVFTDGSISDDACNYLFIDSADGVVINEAGLYSRKTVFTGLGITHKTYMVPTISPPVMEVSPEYIQAFKEGRALSQLVQKKGVKWVKKKVRKAAKKDPVLRHNLARRPYQTLERLLGVKVPEVLDLRIIEERGRTFGLVL